MPKSENNSLRIRLFSAVTVSVRSQGGTYLYNTVGITIYKLGEIPV